MPDTGTRSANSFEDLPELGPGDGWPMAGRLVQLTYEVSKDAALAQLPDLLGRPVPCYARVVVLEAEQSPVGKLRAALLLLGGRHGMLPGSFLVDAVVEGDAAALAARLGGVQRAGRVSLSREAEAVRVEIEGDEGVLARLELPALSAAPVAMLRFDPWLALARQGKERVLVRSLLEAGGAEAFLSKRAALEVAPSLARASVWRRLASLGTIAACLLEGELSLGEREVAQAIGA
jgi:hypothetical protein